MRESIKCPLCKSTEVIENPIHAEIKKDKRKSPLQQTYNLHRYKCLKCGHEFD